MKPRVHDWVAYHAARQPDMPAITSVERGTTLSWGDLEDRVARLACLLRETCKLQSGDRVGLIAENDIRTFEVQFACMRAGLVLVPFNWRLSLHENVALARDARPQLIIHDHIWQDSGQAIAEACGISRRLCWSDSQKDSEYDRLIAASEGRMQGGFQDEDTVTHILYTSGTTGLPKGVLCSQGTLKHHAINVAHTSRMAERGGHHLNVVPLFHAGGLNTYSNPMLYWGGHVTTLQRFDPAAVLALLSDPSIGLTHFCAVQQMFELITELPQFQSASFPTMKVALFGGWGPKAVSLHKSWRARGLFLQLSYGSTEQGPLVAVLEDGQMQADQNCSGTIVPGTELRLVDPAGKDVRKGEVGEIWTRGPAITPGYWNLPQDQHFSGDWFRTGDCGRQDDGGRLYIVDRLREVYRSGGENVYPAEVERVLSQVPGVREIAIIPVPDARWGEVGMAVVEPAPGAIITLEMVLSHGQQQLARFKLPRHLVKIDQMPRSATLKIDRAALKRLYGAAP
jgi:fatty-acyl-CoA synthase